MYYFSFKVALLAVVSLSPFVVLPQSQLRAITGFVKDSATGQPLQYVSVTWQNGTRGTVTNNEGKFKFFLTKVSDTIRFSHVGYRVISVATRGINQDIEVRLPELPVELNPVVIDAILPSTVIKYVARRINTNYCRVPAQLTGFFRQSAFTSLEPLYIAEAVIKVWKPSYADRSEVKQIALLKARAKEYLSYRSSPIGRMVGGPYIVFREDPVHVISQFLDSNRLERYFYEFKDTLGYGESQVVKIDFKPINSAASAHYEGSLWVNIHNYVLVQAYFRLTPKGIAFAHFDQMSPLTRLEARYLDKTFFARYSSSAGGWYLSHVVYTATTQYKGKRKFTYTRKGEFVCTIIDLNAPPIPSRERYPPSAAFFNDALNFNDPDFWLNFDIMLPDVDSLNRNPKLK